MATWEDGPEYAPVEPPAAFLTPDTPPHEVAPAPPPPAPEPPRDRPTFGGPSAPVVPLESLVPGDALPSRDPSLPFEVTTGPAASAPSTAAWSSSAWTAAHGRNPNAPIAARPGPVPSAATTDPPWSTPAPVPVSPLAARLGPAPTTPLLVPPTAPPAVNGYPVSGSPQWFGPGPAAPVPVAGESTARRVVNALTPGLLITLGISVIYPLAPICLLIAFALSSRVTVARSRVRTVFLVALGLVALVAMVKVPGSFYFSDWYNGVAGWALLINLLLVPVLLGVVAVELRRRPQPPSYPPSFQGRWG